MLEKAREEHTFSNVWSQDGKIMFFNKNTKLKFIIVIFFCFFGDEPDQLWREKNVVPIGVLLIYSLFQIMSRDFNHLKKEQMSLNT